MLLTDSYAIRRNHILMIVIPIFFGFYSIFLGQDVGWDLRDYHFYNGFAFLNKKINIDFAPAGYQSYFNPLLDAIYYKMALNLWPPLIGFILGYLQGLNFILILIIAQKILKDLKGSDYYTIPLLLAITGCLTPTFLWVVGKITHDTITSLFNLCSLICILHFNEEHGKKNILYLYAAGLISGALACLKLTNIIYPTSIFLSLAIHNKKQSNPFSLLIFGTFFLFGIAISNGFWFSKMWILFKNPFFPQFGFLFKNSFISTNSVADGRFIPKKLYEYFIWPIITAINHENYPSNHVIWIPIYILLIILPFKNGINFKFKNISNENYIITYVSIAYVLWMMIFSIDRYLISAEILAPLIIWILSHKIFPKKNNYNPKKISLGIILVSILGGIYTSEAATINCAIWSSKSFHVEIPSYKNIEKAVIVLGNNNYPYSWIIPFFPVQTKFLSFSLYQGIHQENQDSQELKHYIHSILDTHKESLYLIIKSNNDPIDNALQTTNKTLEEYKLSNTAIGCNVLKL
jgi:hypothetical protein